MSRGEITIGQIAKIILGLAVALVLFSLMIRIFSPVFNRDDEVAKSYFETLKDEIDIARGGGKGEFFMWNLGNDKEFYVVYFGDSIEAIFDKNERDIVESEEVLESVVRFNSFSDKSNNICVCSFEDGDSICRYCYGLDYPAVFEFKSSPWVLEGGYRVGIEFEEDRYVFSNI